jgi:predicted nucleic acid-binding protein
VKIYLDLSCLNRPFDNQMQLRIRLESETIIFILQNFNLPQWEWISSETLQLEMEHIPVVEMREHLMLLTLHAHRIVRLQQKELKRAQQLKRIGFNAFDALHLACAESGNADIFLTSDKELLQQATQVSDKLNISVVNPLWLLEVI